MPVPAALAVTRRSIRRHSLNDAEKAALANDKEFQKELSSLTRESNKELNQSTEVYELVSKLGAIAVKAALGLAGGALLGAVGDIGLMAANGNRASTANFEFDAGDKINNGLANEIAIIQTVMSKLTSVTPEIVAQIENGKFTKEQIKDMVMKEVKQIVNEVANSRKVEASERPKEESQSTKSPEVRHAAEEKRRPNSTIAEQDNGMGI